MKYGFARLFRVRVGELQQFILNPFDRFREERYRDELLGSRQSDHVAAAPLDLSRNSAEAFVMAEGAEDYLSAEPEVIVLSDRRMFQSSPQNYAFVWRRPNKSVAIVVPLAHSSQLVAIEERRKSTRLSCNPAFRAPPAA